MKMMQAGQLDVDAMFAALANPTRRDILAKLSRQRLSVGELAAAYEMTGPAVTQHLNVLERAGLIRREARAQWRDCVAVPGALSPVSAWIEGLRGEWSERFDRLEQRLAQRQAEEQG
jgi:DNA-binding transcriptional ArsR family regulator